jgi:large conductance mechanosensitive channel
MSVVQEFKQFALRGNVVDMAVGIIVGGAFGKIATSFVNDVVMPPIGLLLGGADFSHLAVTLREKTAEADAVTLKWGAFVNTVLDFAVVAVAIFALVKLMNAVRKREEEQPQAPPPPSQEVVLLGEIRDALRIR